MFRLLLLLLSVMSIAGCDRTPASPSTDEPIRIVSLSPAITRAIEDLGLADALIGRSTWCQLDTREVETIPAVGDLHERDWERLVRLQPTHVLFQASDVETDEALVEVAGRHGWILQAWPLRTMGEVGEMLDDMPDLFSAAETAEQIRLRCLQGSDHIRAAIKPATEKLDERVLIVSDGQPCLAWGESTYLGEMLESTGAVNVMGHTAWKTISFEDIIRLDPDVMLIVSETDSREPSTLDELDVQATRDNRVHHLSHRYINLPGAHLATMADEIQSAVGQSAVGKQSF